MATKEKTRKRSSRNTRDACSRCARRTEAFYCYKKNFVFDVDLARSFVSDGRQPIELDPVDVEWAISRCQINESHVPHVDPAIPGIVAHMFFLDEDGTYAHGHRVIDGHHRAVRCTEMGLPYMVYVLSEAESIACLSKAPAEAKPEYIEPAEIPDDYTCLA